LDGAVYAGP